MKRKKPEVPAKGPCTDCEYLLPYDTGEAYGRCQKNGRLIQNLEAYADTHACFRLAAWLADVDADIEF